MNLKSQSSGVKSFVDIKPTQAPSPCTYSPEKGAEKVKPDYKKSMIKFLPVSKKILNFVEDSAKKKEWVPPPGTYNGVISALDHISKPSPRYKLRR